MAFRAVALLGLLATLSMGIEEETWGPADGVMAFGSLEAALSKVLNSHMTPERREKAKHVVEDVRRAIAEVQSPGSNLTKAQRKAKVGAAVKELLDLQKDFVHAVAMSNMSASTEARLAALNKELTEKKAELAKDEARLKMYTLQKELMEKKLALQKLIEKKRNAQSSKANEAKEAVEESALIDKLQALTGSLANVSGDKAELPAPLKAALSEVQAREKKEEAALAKIEDANKQTMAGLDAEAKKPLPTMGSNDALKKGQSMILRLKKEEHRQFLKARALKQRQVSELKDVERSIQRHDVKTLQTALNKMRRESQAAAAKSGSFLH